MVATAGASSAVLPTLNGLKAGAKASAYPSRSVLPAVARQRIPARAHPCTCGRLRGRTCLFVRTHSRSCDQDGRRYLKNLRCDVQDRRLSAQGFLRDANGCARLCRRTRSRTRARVLTHARAAHVYVRATAGEATVKTVDGFGRVAAVSKKVTKYTKILTKVKKAVEPAKDLVKEGVTRSISTAGGDEGTLADNLKLGAAGAGFLGKSFGEKVSRLLKTKQKVDSRVQDAVGKFQVSVDPDGMWPSRTAQPTTLTFAFAVLCALRSPGLRQVNETRGNDQRPSPVDASVFCFASAGRFRGKLCRADKSRDRFRDQ